MILEFLNMGGYGLYIWLSYAFAALSLISLYYVSVKKLNSINVMKGKVKKMFMTYSVVAKCSNHCW